MHPHPVNCKTASGLLPDVVRRGVGNKPLTMNFDALASFGTGSERIDDESTLSTVPFLFHTTYSAESHEPVNMLNLLALRVERSEVAEKSVGYASNDNRIHG